MRIGLQFALIFNKQKANRSARHRSNLGFGIFLNVLYWDLVLSLLLCASAGATDRFWTNAAGGTFNATANWFANTVPLAADNANFTNNASYPVNWTASATNANAFFNADLGTVTQ